MSEAEMIARIERLEELVIAIWQRSNSTELAQQMESELYEENRLPTPYPVSMETRILFVEDRLGQHKESE